CRGNQCITQFDAVTFGVLSSDTHRVESGRLRSRTHSKRGPVTRIRWIAGVVVFDANDKLRDGMNLPQRKPMRLAFPGRGWIAIDKMKVVVEERTGDHDEAPAVLDLR